MAGIDTLGGNGSSLENLLGKTPEEIREILKECSVDKLKDLEKEAAKNRQYKIAEIIKEVLEDKIKSGTTVDPGDENTRSQLVTAISTRTSNEATTQEIREESAETPNETTTANLDNELVKTDGEFINLWRKQQEVAKKIEDYYKERGIKNEFGIIIPIHPSTITFDGDSIFVDDMWNIHLFKQVNGEIKEIPLLKDKMDDSCKIKSICKIGDYYAVNLCFLDANGRIKKNYKGEESSLKFIIDKDGNYLSQLGEQTGKDEFRSTDSGEYNLEKDLGDNKVIRMIFNKNMEQIARYEEEKNVINKKYIVYCDDKVCILKEPGTPLYTVFSENQIVGELTKEDLKGNEYMKGFLKNIEQKELQIIKSQEEHNRIHSNDFEERYMDKNHCKIEYKDGKKTVIIKNDKGKSLFKLSNIEEISYSDEYRPYFRTNAGDYFEIQNWQRDDNVLFIQVLNSEKHIQKSIFINKNNGEKKEFEGHQGYSSFLKRKLIEVFINNNDAKIFDDNLNYLGMLDKEEDNLGFLTIKGKDGESYIVSYRLGKKVCEYGKILNSYTEGKKRFLIIGDCQVEV